MATTTNYSWTTPDDTALVKDGAAAIRSLGTAIDSTVFTNAGNAIAKTIVDAKGDLIVATAADTVARLASSASNGDLLTVDTSTASGLKWAAPAGSGGMTLIATTTFNNTTTTYTYSSLGSYKHLYIVGQGLTHNTSGTANIEIQFNNDSGNNYDRAGVGMNTGTIDTSYSSGTSSAFLSFRAFADNDDASLYYGTFNSWIPSYREAGYKSVHSTTYSNISGNTPRVNTSVSTWNNTNAITEIKITAAGGSNFRTGLFLLYGVS
jgi:hypothetical protein